MRNLRFSLVAVALLAMPAPSVAQDPGPTPDSVASVSSNEKAVPHLERLQLIAGTELTIGALDLSRPTSPRPFGTEVPLMALAAAAATRRSAAKKGSKRSRADVPMILDSDVHVMRKGEDSGKKETTVIKHGQLVDDTDLSEDEIDELTARKVIRPAKPEELERIEEGDPETERKELVAAQEQELEKLRASHATARAKLEGSSGSTPAKLAALDEKNAKEIEKLQAKHTDALNALGE